MINELIPIDHYCVSESIVDDIVLVKLYKEAGMKTRSNKLLQSCVSRVCSENNIPILVGHRAREYGIQNWEGLNWEVKTISETLLDVPVPVLKKMAKVKDKENLYIAFPSQRKISDPVLLYMLPCYKDDCYYIELARWE